MQYNICSKHKTGFMANSTSTNSQKLHQDNLKWCKDSIVSSFGFSAPHITPIRKALKSFTFLLFSFLLFSVASCEEEEFNPYKEQWENLSKLDKSQIYKVPVSEYSDFDEALYKDGKYIAIKTDTINGLYIYFVGRDDIDENEGVFVILNMDGTLNAFGKPGNIMFTCVDENGTLALVSPNRDSKADIKIISTEKSSNTGKKKQAPQKHHGYDPYSWIKVGLGTVPYLGDILGICDLGKAWNSHNTLDATTNLFTLALNYTPYKDISLPISILANEWEQQCNELRWRLYGDAEPEITSVVPLGYGYHEVTLKINNASTLSRPYTANIEDTFGSRQISANRETYVSVDCNRIANAGTGMAYSSSDEVLVENKDNGYEVVVTLQVYIPEGKITYLRPHLNSYLRFSGDQIFHLFDKQYRYGKDYPYVYADVKYRWKQISAVGQAWSQPGTNTYKRSIDFQLELYGEKKTQDLHDIAIADWGVVFINKEGHIAETFSFVENNEDHNPNANKVSTTFNYTFHDDELTIDENNCTASVEDWLICSYVQFLNPNDWIPLPETVYGVPSDFSLHYKGVPSIRYTSSEYVGTYIYDETVWGWGKPFLINYEEKIYADAESNFNTFTETNGAFFIKDVKWRTSGSGWTKYCSASFNSYNEQGIDVIDGQGCGVKHLAWNREHFECTSTLQHYIEFTATNGQKNVSNTISLKPIPHKDSEGNTYYFGYKPDI